MDDKLCQKLISAYLKYCNLLQYSFGSKSSEKQFLSTYPITDMCRFLICLYKSNAADSQSDSTNSGKLTRITRSISSLLTSFLCILFIFFCDKTLKPTPMNIYLEPSQFNF